MGRKARERLFDPEALAAGRNKRYRREAEFRRNGGEEGEATAFDCRGLGIIAAVGRGHRSMLGIARMLMIGMLVRSGFLGAMLVSGVRRLSMRLDETVPLRQAMPFIEGERGCRQQNAQGIETDNGGRQPGAHGFGKSRQHRGRVIA